jgi:Flp pilus assembly secretin CpaC
MLRVLLTACLFGCWSSLLQGAEPQPAPPMICGTPAFAAQQTAPLVADLHRAADRLAQSGLAEEAAQLRTLIKQIEQKSALELAAKSLKLKQLQQELRALRNLAGDPVISIRCQFLEVDATSLPTLGLSDGPQPGTGDQPAGTGIVPAMLRVSPFQSVSGNTRVEADRIELQGNVAFATQSNLDVTAAIQTIRQNSQVKLLAGPTILTTPGQPARVESRHQILVNRIGGNGKPFTTACPIGVKLEALPTLLDDDRIRVQLSAEISERDFAQEVEVNGKQVPGHTTRELCTTVDIDSGRSVVIASRLIPRDTTAGGDAKADGEKAAQEDRALVVVISAERVETARAVTLNPLPTY